jgi:FKBP-type peptidyl-prolyl cis-trans isomerase FkpA
MNLKRIFTVLSLLPLRLAAAALALAMLVGSVANDSQAGENDELFYHLGAALGRSLSEFELSKDELKDVQKGLAAVVTGKDTAPPTEEQMLAIGELRNERVAKATVAFLDSAKKDKGAKVQESGLIYFEEEAGSGASPSGSDTVKVHYHGMLLDGTVFDSSVERGEPAEFPLDRVIACWSEGVAMMKIGGKAKLVCPPAIAYGDRGAPPAIPPGAVLIFNVELLEVTAKAAE